MHVCMYICTIHTTVCTPYNGSVVARDPAAWRGRWGYPAYLVLYGTIVLPYIGDCTKVFPVLRMHRRAPVEVCQATAAKVAGPRKFPGGGTTRPRYVTRRLLEGPTEGPSAVALRYSIVLTRPADPRPPTTVQSTYMPHTTYCMYATAFSG